MIQQLKLEKDTFETRAVSPLQELGAYEALWMEPKCNFKSISKRFQEAPGALPSDFVSIVEARKHAATVRASFEKANVSRFGVRVQGAAEYPDKLRDAEHPIQLLYYKGWWDLVQSRCIAVVGTRNPSPAGIERTKKLVKALVKDDFTIVSGLAAGVDTVAHKTAISEGGRTIAVIGTPLSHVYPKENAALQDQIAKDFLVISQVPVQRYESQDYRINRLFFPERNITMSALTEATVIVEAGETSGTLIQAKAALRQGRKLFILESCFNNSQIEWPHKFAEKGAIRVREYNDIQKHLPPPVHED